MKDAAIDGNQGPDNSEEMDEEQKLMASLGFAGFDSSKVRGTKENDMYMITFNA